MNDEEVAFRDILLLTAMRQDGDIMTGYKFRDSSSQAKLAGLYAMQAETVRKDLEKQARANDEVIAMAIGGGTRGQISAVQEARSVLRESKEVRAERDLWSLLDVLTRSNLIRDLDNDDCEKSLSLGLSVLTVRSGAAAVINAAYQSDDRIKKGGILLEWLESAAVDRIILVPGSGGNPWSETLAEILQNKKKGNKGRERDSLTVQSLHPDAQLDSKCLVLPLKGSDCDQQLLRCGKMREAQEYCVQNKSYWLAASLLGSSHPFYELVESENMPNIDIDEAKISSVVAKKGNSNRSVWMHSCWQYAEKIEKNPGNNVAYNKKGENFVPGPGTSGTFSGVLEMSIYATLSCNLRVLSASPLLQTFSDHLWSVVKTAHERDLLAVIHEHRKAKVAYSGRFPGCGQRLVAVESQLLQLLTQAAGQIALGDCEGLFERAASGVKASTGVREGYLYGDSFAESVLLQLTALLMEGRAGLKVFIDTIYTDILQNPSEQDFPGISRVLRVFCHLALWLRSSPPATSIAESGLESESDLSELMSEDLLQLAVESYAQHLISEKKRALVAAYCAHLTAPRRVALYSRLVLSMVHDLPRVTSGGNVNTQLSSYNASEFDYRSGGSALTVFDSTARSRVLSVAVPSEITEVIRLALTVLGETDMEEIMKTVMEAVRCGDESVRCRLLSLITPPLEVFRISADVCVDKKAGKQSVRSIFQPTRTNSYNDAYISLATSQNEGGGLGPGRSDVKKGGGGWRRDHAVGWGKQQKDAPSPALSPGRVLLGDIERYRSPSKDSPSADYRDRDWDGVCVDSLQLLLLDPTHTCLAVHEANRLMSHALLEDVGAYSSSSASATSSSSLSCLRKVLRNVMPADIVTRGWDCLELKLGRITQAAVSGCELWSDKRDGMGNDDDPLSARMLELITQSADDQMSILKAQWTADVAYLQLWGGYLGAMEAQLVFVEEMQKQQSAADRMLGGREILGTSLSRFRPKILQTATAALESLLAALMSTATTQYPSADRVSDFQANNESDASDGLRDVFRGMTEALSSGFNCAAVRSLKIIQVLIEEQSKREQSKGPASVRNEEEEEEIRDFDFQEKHEMYISSHALLKQAVADLAPVTVEEVLQSLLTPDIGSHAEGESLARDIRGAATSATAAALLSETHYSCLREGVLALGESAVLLKSLGVAIRQHPSSSSLHGPSSYSVPDVQLESEGDQAIMSALGDCTTYSAYVADLDGVAGAMTFSLLSKYLEVVMSTAGFLLSALDHKVEAHSWLAKGAQLSDLIASEDPSLQLFRLVSRDGLSSLLSKINVCCVQMMQIYPVFTVENLEQYIARAT